MDNTILALHLKPLLLYVNSKGFDSNDLLSAVEIDPSIFDSTRSRLTYDEVDRLYYQASLMTNDDNLGLHLGEHYTVESLSVIGQIIMNCSTVREIHEKLDVYGDILRKGDGSSICEDENCLVTIEYFTEYRHPTSEKQFIDCMISVWITIMSRLTGTRIQPIEVRLKHKAPQDTSEYRRILQAPVLFEQSMNSVIVERSYLDLPILYPNSELLNLLEEHAMRILNEIQDDKPFTKKTSQFIISKLPDEVPNITTAAKEFTMSLRNFQRKLKNENTTYRNIVDQVYKSIAITHLKNEDISISEIAFLLGFSDNSSFHRSFKRLMGLTPAEYRSSIKNR